MWALSNVAAGTREHIARLSSAQTASGENLPTVLVQGLVSGTPDVQCEGAWVVYNVIMGGGPEHQAQMMQPTIVRALCAVLESPKPEAVLIALQALELLLRASKRKMPPSANGGPSPVATMVEECGGSDQLDYLNAHENEEIYELAARVLKDHFEDEPEDDGPMPPIAG
jgi:hypothetical protein